MKRYNIKRKILSEDGGATVLVFFTVFTFLIVAMGAFMTVSILRKSQSKSDIRIQEIYGEDVEKIDDIYKELKTYALYDTPYIPTGFEYTEGTWNSGYTIKETATGNEFVWVPCVLDQTKVKDGDTVVTLEKITKGKYNESSLGLLPSDTSVMEEDSSVLQIETSVKNYGGFYIARYEAGVPLDENGNEISVEKAIVNQKTRSVSGATAWTNITREDAITVAANMIDTTSGVKSCLVSGAAWDTTLQWMVSASDNNVLNKGYDIDSSNKGWYNDVSSGNKTVTGQYKVNNIYDMAGNVWEWTTENGVLSNENYVICRGGRYNALGSNLPAASRGNFTDYKAYSIGFRVVLYK